MSNSDGCVAGLTRSDADAILKLCDEDLPITHLTLTASGGAQYGVDGHLLKLVITRDVEADLRHQVWRDLKPAVDVDPLGLTFFLRDIPEGGVMTQLGHQSLGVIVAALASAVGTLVLLVLVDKTLGLKLDERRELAGLDHALHGEHGYGMLNPN